MTTRPYGEALDDGRMFIAAAERNKHPILDVLKNNVPTTGAALEIASGTGQHVVHFASAFPDIDWQPSDPGADFRRSVALRVADAGLENISDPVALNVLTDQWPAGPFDAVVCINMIHVAPWSATEALIDGAASVLNSEGLLILYGPYKRKHQHTSAGNEQFDADLRQHDSSWGLRNLEDVVDRAERNGFMLENIVDMPANNFTVIFRRKKV